MPKKKTSARSPAANAHLATRERDGAPARSARHPAGEHTVRHAGGGQAARAKSPRNHRELAQAIFAECDPITVGRELLESGSERGSNVKARVWETLVEFLLGKPAPAAGAASGAGVRIVWDLPAPPHEAHES